ncbi:MAG: O-antigen ligase family protein [Thiotrichales bacterium]|nr:O-antigen ligase family protein [Thiotrichales bacterium]
MKAILLNKISVSWLEWALLLYALVFFTLPGGINILPGLLFLLGLGLASSGSWSLCVDERRLFFAFTLYFIAAWLGWGFHQEPLNILDEPLKFLMISVVLFVIVRSHVRIAFFWAFVVLALLFSAIDAIWIGDYAWDGSRLAGTVITHPLYFGNLSLLFAFLALAGWIWTEELPSVRMKRLWRLGLILAFGLGVMLSLLSGTRGGWIAIPLAFYFVFYHLVGSAPYRKIWRILAISILVLGFVTLMSFENSVQQRLVLAWHDLVGYFDAGEVSSSLGARLEMWRLGVELGSESPFWGLGQNGYVAGLQALIDTGQAHPDLRQFAQLHNQYLQEWVFRGVFGLGALLWLFFTLLKFYMARLTSPCAATRALAVAGAVSCFLYLDFFLSISMWHLNATTLSFLIVIAFTAGFILARENAVLTS